MMDHKFIGLDVDDMIFGKDDRDQSAVNRGALLVSTRFDRVVFLYLFGTSQPTCGCVEPLLRSLYDKTYSAKAPKHANGQPAAAGWPVSCSGKTGCVQAGIFCLQPIAAAGGPASVPCPERAHSTRSYIGFFPGRPGAPRSAAVPAPAGVQTGHGAAGELRLLPCTSQCIV